jgi:CrcB protein
MPEWIGAAPEGYPLGTLAVNVSGAALLGLIVGSFAHTARFARVRAFATAGFCGGYTTFSTFSGEVVQLANAGNVGAAVLYALASVIGSLVALAICFRLGQRLRPTARVRAEGPLEEVG